MSAAPRICAIIVAYNPAAGALENTLERIRPQVDTIVIVNNGDSITGAVDGLAGQVALIQQPGNMGIAHAHNVGIEWARQHGTNFVLLLQILFLLKTSHTWTGSTHGHVFANFKRRILTV